MKWIGQYIVDLIARFRGDVYIEKSDLYIYDAVNDGNPTINLGSSAGNKLEIGTKYNSGAQGVDSVIFRTYTDGTDVNDGKFSFYVDEVLKMEMLDASVDITGNINIDGDTIKITSDTTSDANKGATLRLVCDDGAAMGDDHRLGVIEFIGAEDGSATISLGARIQAVARDAWDGTNNDADLEFYTTDGITESKILTLDADKLATFAGDVKIDGNITNNVITITDTTTSSATQGGSLKLVADDDDVLADNHRLGVIEFQSREVGSGGIGYSATGNIQTGARIQAIADATWSATENGASLEFYTTDGNASESKVLTIDSDKLATFTGEVTCERIIKIINTTTSSSTEGAIVNLICNDGAALGDDHRLGSISFAAAEDSSSTLKVGASIQAFADAAWSSTENGTRLVFSTMDGNASSEQTLTLDSNLLATFTGSVTVGGSALTFDSVALTGIQTSAEGFNDDDVSVMTSAAINDRISSIVNTTHASTQTGKNYRIINTSFRDDIGTDKHYLPLKDIAEQVVLTREEIWELAVCDGRLASATVRVENMQTTHGAFDLTIGVHTNVINAAYASGTEIETEVLEVTDTSDDHHVFHFVFDTAKHWDTTDMFTISIQSSADAWGSQERFFVTLVIEDDWSTYLGGSSREISATP